MLKYNAVCTRRTIVFKRFNSSKFNEEPRINQVGIQYLSEGLQRQVFPLYKAPVRKRKDSTVINLAKLHLKKNGLLGKKTFITEPIDFKIPKLHGQTLDEHFYKLGVLKSDKYLQLAENLIKIGSSLPKKPKKWVFKSGWYRYLSPKNEPEPVPYPLEDNMVFDVEVLYKISNFPTLATCVSTKAWYSWVSPYLTGESDKVEHLIPMNNFETEKLIVGHNVSYDRARIKDEYNLKQSKAFFLDTMSLHVAVSGMCSRQRPTWMKYKKNKAKKLEEDETDEDELSLDKIRSDIENSDLQELINNPVLDLENSDETALQEDPWMKVSSLNSLANVADFYCGITMDKAVRDYFSSEDKQVIIDNFQKLMDYCANDVYATFKVFSKVFPAFRKIVPHPVSFAALRHIAQSFLPTNESWARYIENTEKLYVETKLKIEKNLHRLANEVVKLKDKIDLKNPNAKKPWEDDPWLSQLDWTIAPVKYTKKGVPYKNQKLPGYPEWYKKLIVKNELKLTTRTRIAPLLLRLSWDKYPLFWLDTYGWCFVAPIEKKDHYLSQNFTHISNEKLYEDPNWEQIPSNYYKEKCIFKVPHSDGAASRTFSVMTKSSLAFFEKGVLTSDYDLAKDALQLVVSSSYWTSARERIINQFVVHNYDNNGKEPVADFGLKEKIGIILPNVVTMGTITRRSVENTWLTASNAKKTRLGSELKSMIKAPAGYCFVGADVDSEELWIASLIGDSVFQIHGGSAIGWMTLEGTKNEGTDLHSKTANILGISRNEAKVFNYGRIYGAGLKFATTLLKKFNPTLPNEKATEIARNLYSATKGKTGIYSHGKIWYGGSESIVFNRLEKLAEQDAPKTPVLGAGITSALTKKNLKANSFLPSRINWAIQSSGVDYLHLLIISMDYLSSLYNVDARLSITIHDEIRYLVKEEDKFKAAIILQISNLWTRAMFCQQLGINEVPQSCAFFSAVDIDKVLRKEVNLDCITPSNPIAIAHGQSLDIKSLLEIPGMKKFFEDTVKDLDLTYINYDKRKPIIKNLDDVEFSNRASKELFIKLQIVKTDEEFKNVRKDLKKAVLASQDDAQRKIFEAEYFSKEEDLTEEVAF
ncbi:hypothetical protein PACTADRAFT_50596 [Pachysolen tannophilus NRRL Y-2460]|uniref:DNA polymerase gamma n=1 Tax=Pachysolen tannophilus NRRL Y-2460 TaxID=669874 RepID=A0A1E4TSJ7_PACTA|nr:hypothetical protein PACTADRAFT_50596 [Pachysolen tannophilus NRRL Y-2460]